MASILEVCVALAVTGSLVAVLVYGAVFLLAALRTILTRRRPDPVALAVDDLLVDVLGDAAIGGVGAHVAVTTHGPRNHPRYGADHSIR